MFDWNDEEFRNILWGVPGERDDHIVPYPQRSEDYSNKRQKSQEMVDTREYEQKTLGSNIDIHCKTLRSCSNFGKNEGISSSGFSMDLWTELSISNTKTGQDSMDTEASENLTETGTYDKSSGGTAQFHEDSEVFQNSLEGKEQGDFVDYSWANIGSFDDLDRIFSNDDPIFGHASLCKTDELWSSSKNVINSPENSISISSKEDESFTYGCWRNHVSHCLPNAHAIMDHEEYAGGISKPIVMQTDVDMVENTTSANPCQFVNVYGQTELLKGRRRSEIKGEGKLPQFLCGSWSPPGNSASQVENQSKLSMVQSCPPSLDSKQRLYGHESFQYQQASNPLISPLAYGSPTNTYPVMHVQSHLPGENIPQPLPSGFEIYQGNMNPIHESTDTSVNSLIMTPREKIEKLRKHQQMQARLAIQKQQRQIHPQVPCEGHSITQQFPQKNQIQCFQGADLEVENATTYPSLDPASPVEHDSSNTNSMAVDNYSMDATILYRLQDTIAKLDMKTRVCIRDSLLRLAQNVKQRHFASDTSSTSKSSKKENEVITNQEFNIRDRNPSMPNAETETNPIDRIVAHFLFKRPPEFSVNLPQHVNQFRNNPSINTSKNASHNERSDVSHMFLLHDQRNLHGAQFINIVEGP